jgi:hypothetical protein
VRRALAVVVLRAVDVVGLEVAARLAGAQEGEDLVAVEVVVGAGEEEDAVVEEEGVVVEVLDFFPWLAFW